MPKNLHDHWLVRLWVWKLRATLHMRLRARDHYTRALSMVQKVEPIQVRCFTLCLRDQRSMWMQEGCKVYMGFYMALNGSCFMVTWTVFKNHLLDTKPGDHGTPNAHNRRFILLYRVWGHTWIDIDWNSISLWTQSNMTSHCTWGFVTTLNVVWRCVGMAFGHFLLGSHSFMVTALGLVCGAALSILNKSMPVLGLNVSVSHD